MSVLDPVRSRETSTIRDQILHKVRLQGNDVKRAEDYRGEADMQLIAQCIFVVQLSCVSGFAVVSVLMCVVLFIITAVDVELCLDLTCCPVAWFLTST